MKPPGFLGRWLAFLRLQRPQPPAELRRSFDAAAQRDRQRAVAREAFLSNLPPGQRLLANPYFGENH